MGAGSFAGGCPSLAISYLFTYIWVVLGVNVGSYTMHLVLGMHEILKWYYFGISMKKLDSMLPSDKLAFLPQIMEKKNWSLQ